MNHHCHRAPIEVFLKHHNYRSAHMNPVKDDDGTQPLVCVRGRDFVREMSSFHYGILLSCSFPIPFNLNRHSRSVE